MQLRLAIDDRPKSVRQAQPESLIRMLALLSNQEAIRISIGQARFEMVQTYTFEVAMDDVVGVKDLEPVTDVEELGGMM